MPKGKEPKVKTSMEIDIEIVIGSMMGTGDGKMTTKKREISIYHQATMILN